MAAATATSGATDTDANAGTAGGCSAGTTAAASSFAAGAGGKAGSRSGRGGGAAPSGSMGETRPGERMRRGSMSPPRPTSLDEVGEPWKDGADGDLGGTFRPAAAAAEGGSGRRSGLSGAPVKSSTRRGSVPSE